MKYHSDTVDLIATSLTYTARIFFRGKLEFSADSHSVQGLLVAVLVTMAPLLHSTRLTGVLCWGWFQKPAHPWLTI